MDKKRKNYCIDILNKILNLIFVSREDILERKNYTKNRD